MHKTKYNQIIIGIDPGKYPGIAFLGDGKVISVYQGSVYKVKDIIQQALKNIISENILIRIGHGARLLRTQIVNSLIELNIPIELVDETGTTPKNKSDIIAAINIAQIKGKQVGKQYIEPSIGEIRVIQERSRKQSNGTLTIPRALAKKVAKGEITLEEAIDKHKKGVIRL